MASLPGLDQGPFGSRCDVKTKQIVAIEVTDERVSDGSKFNSLIDQAEENVSGRKIEEALV